VLGVTVSRAFGDSLWKWSLDFQKEMKQKLSHSPSVAIIKNEGLLGSILVLVTTGSAVKYGGVCLELRSREHLVTVSGSGRWISKKK
jgi:hypothetical protein